MSPHGRSQRRLAGALVTTALFSACIVFVGPADRDDHVRDLVAARARWNTNGVTDYAVTARTICFCVNRGQPVRVTVRGGVVTSAILVNTGQGVDSAFIQVYRPVERLFDLIEDAVARHAHRIDVTYEVQYGFPASFFIDYSEQAADEEFGYEITAYTPLSR